MRWLPGLLTLRQYQAGWLPSDIVAGLVLSTMLVPVGMAYAVASGLPGIYGLYATIVPLLAYAVFGPSRILVLGPELIARRRHIRRRFAIVCWRPAARGGAGRNDGGRLRDRLHSSRCRTVGIHHRASLQANSLWLHERYRIDRSNQPAAQTFRLFDRERWSAAQHVGYHRSCRRWQDELDRARNRAGSLAVILLLKNSKRIPGILVAVVGATVVVGAFDLAARAGLSVLGPLPQGLPSFAIPWISSTDVVPVLIGGVAVALVSFADTSVLSRAYAARMRRYVDPNQEMVGLGAANLAAGFFQGFPISSSSSRTPVAEAAGARTQLTGIVGALAVAVLLLAAPNLLQNLPTTALAAVVIASAIGLIEITDLIRIYRIQRWEFWLSIVCFVGVAVFGAIPGIGVAVVIAVIEFLWDGWRPHSAVLGRAEGVEGYHDITRYPDARQEPGLVLFRWDAPLFFANAELFKERVLIAAANSPSAVRWLVVAAEPVTSVDITAADVVTELHQALNDGGISLRFAELKDPVKDKLRRFGLLEQLGEECFFPTVEAAVDSYLQFSAAKTEAA